MDSTQEMEMLLAKRNVQIRKLEIEKMELKSKKFQVLCRESVGRALGISGES